MSGERQDDIEAGALVAAALLADPVRRRLYRFVRRARRPVTRDEAAASAGISRNLAAFHLDKLVESGLLRADVHRAGGRLRVGRRSKVYEPGPVELHVDVPRRQHALLAGLLVEALTAGAGDDAARRAAAEAARRRGTQVGREARRRVDVEALLERIGFEPYEAGPATLRLANCPFHPLAAESPELVCRLNLELISGLLAGVGAGPAGAVLAPRTGECCVEIRFGPAEPPAA